LVCLVLSNVKNYINTPKYLVAQSPEDKSL